MASVNGTPSGKATVNGAPAPVNRVAATPAAKASAPPPRPVSAGGVASEVERDMARAREPLPAPDGQAGPEGRDRARLLPAMAGTAAANVFPYTRFDVNLLG